MEIMDWLSELEQWEKEQKNSGKSLLIGIDTNRFQTPEDVVCKVIYK